MSGHVAGVQTVLVVEDNPITRKYVRVTLSHHGLHVLEAPDAGTALTLVARALPDLVIQDLLLPDMDGFDLVRRLRAIPGMAAVPIIAFSGFLSRMELGRAASVGFTDFIVKPVEPTRLVQMVRMHLPAPEPVEEQAGVRKRILVADDDPVQLKLAGARLVRLGFQVTQARDGVEALESASASPPDAILADVLMPRLDGFGLCVAVRDDARLAKIPVVLISSNYVEEADRRLAENAGARALVVRSPDLREAIDMLLASLRGELPVAPPVPADALSREHLARNLLQLERQAAMNAVFAQRASIHASMLSVVAGISDTLARQQDIQTTLPDILSSLLDACGVSSGAIFLIANGNGPVLRANTGFPPDVGTGFGHLDLLATAADARTAMAVPSGRVSPGVEKDFLERAGVASALIVPFVSGDVSVGVLLIGSRSRDVADPDWALFARTMAVQIGQAIALGNMFSQLARSERRHRVILDHANDATFILNATDGTILETNRGAEALLGRPRTEIVGRSFEPIVWPADLERAWVRYRGVLAEESMVFDDVRLRRSDGTPVSVEYSCAMVTLGDERTMISTARDITERKRIEAALSAARDFTSAIVNTAGMLISVLDPEGRIVTFNRSCEQLSGRPAEEVIGGSWEVLVPPEEQDDVRAVLARLGAGEPSNRHSNHWLTRDGKRRLISWSNTALLGTDGAVRHIIGTGTDVTEQRALEQELRQSQKMEAVGRLAGGVAHDFNNLLTVITGYSDLMLLRLLDGDPLRADLEQIKKAGFRAAGLTRQLLAFSRKQVLAPSIVNLNDIVRNTDKLLGRLIGEDIVIASVLDPVLGTVRADSGQVEQVIMNLAVNARDAMPKGGTLTLETANVEIDETAAVAKDDLKPGAYVLLAVTDTGTGMDAEVRSHLFEPFFTTKEQGKGTGLGLSTVYGIVKQSGGHITVDSEVGRGTMFKIYFPRLDIVADKPEPRSDGGPTRGSETILVVEDEDIVRSLTRRILEMSGYTVLEAGDGAAALVISEGYKGQIHLLVTDVVMPKMGGSDLAQRLASLRPALKVLYLSGYTSGAIAHHGVLDPGVALLQKPFTPDALARRVREVLQ